MLRRPCPRARAVDETTLVRKVVISVFVQLVHAQVDLDRRLRHGDALIVEERAALRDGELFVAESVAGAWIGRYTAGTDPFWMYSLEVGVPESLPRATVHVRGAVIGVRSAI